MDIGEALRTTGSVRAFTDQLVSDGEVLAILDDARFAPSGGNRQPWRVALIKDVDRRRQLADLMRPSWNEYVAASRAGQVPFNAVDYRAAVHPPPASNELIDAIESIPVVLAIAADLRLIVAADAELNRVAVVPGASIYPFCWSVLLAARSRGLGGVMTTLLSRSEPAAAPLIGLPEHHAFAATIFLGHPVHQPTRLRRRSVSDFASVDGFEGSRLG